MDLVRAVFCGPICDRASWFIQDGEVIRSMLVLVSPRESIKDLRAFLVAAVAYLEDPVQVGSNRSPHGFRLGDRERLSQALVRPLCSYCFLQASRKEQKSLDEEGGSMRGFEERQGGSFTEVITVGNQCRGEP